MVLLLEFILTTHPISPEEMKLFMNICYNLCFYSSWLRIFSTMHPFDFCHWKEKLKNRDSTFTNIIQFLEINEINGYSKMDSSFSGTERPYIMTEGNQRTILLMYSALCVFGFPT